MWISCDVVMITHTTIINSDQATFWNVSTKFHYLTLNKSYIGKLHLTIICLQNRCCPVWSDYSHPQAYSISYKRNSTCTYTQSDAPYELNPLPFSSYKDVNVSTTVHLKTKNHITLFTNFVNFKYNFYYTGTGTYNYKLLLSECNQF